MFTVAYAWRKSAKPWKGQKVLSGVKARTRNACKLHAAVGQAAGAVPGVLSHARWLLIEL